MRGIDVKILPIQGHFDNVSHFLICSGDSERHLQTLADVLVRAVRERKLIQAPSFKFGAEGEPKSRMSVLI